MQTFDNRIVYLRLLASRWLWDIRQLYWKFTLSAPAAYHRKTYTVILKTNSSLKYAYSSIFIVVKSFTLKPVTFPQLKEREWKGKSERDVSVRMHLTYTHTHTHTGCTALVPHGTFMSPSGYLLFQWPSSSILLSAFGLKRTSWLLTETADLQ